MEKRSGRARGHEKRRSTDEEETWEPKEVEVETPFLKLHGASDPFLIGFGTCAKWSLALEKDGSGAIWCHFKTFGIRVLADVTSRPTNNQ